MACWKAVALKSSIAPPKVMLIDTVCTTLPPGGANGDKGEGGHGDGDGGGREGAGEAGGGRSGEGNGGGEVGCGPSGGGKYMQQPEHQLQFITTTI